MCDQAVEELAKLGRPKDLGVKFQWKQRRDDIVQKYISLGVALVKTCDTLYEDRRKTLAEVSVAEV